MIEIGLERVLADQRAACGSRAEAQLAIVERERAPPQEAHLRIELTADREVLVPRAVAITAVVELSAIAGALFETGGGALHVGLNDKSRGRHVAREPEVGDREDGMKQAWRENGRPYINYEARDGFRYGLQKSALCYTLEDGAIQ